MKFTLPKNNKKYFILSVGILASFTALLTFAIPAFAVESGSFAAHPTNYSKNDPRTRSWFIYTYSAGEIRQDSVTIENKSPDSVTVKVYPADSTTTTDGAFALKNENDARIGVSSWIKLSQNLVTLAPNEKKDIPFTVSVPSNIQKGEYSGGIIFENTTAQPYKSNKVTFDIISRIGVRIYATVPGQEQLNLKVSDLNYSVVDNNLNFSFTVENKGEVNFIPTGILQLKNILGKVVATVPLNDYFDITFPGDPVVVNVPTNVRAPIVGWYTVDVAAYYSPTKAAIASLTFMPNPWAMYILIFIAVLLLALAVGNKYLVHTNPKTHKTHLAPHIQLIVGAIILGALIFSVLISLFLKTLI